MGLQLHELLLVCDTRSWLLYTHIHRTKQTKPNQKSEKPKQSFVFSEPQLSKTQYSVVSKVIEKCLSLLLQQ